ncbi:hypothetical protein NECAME_18803, partial [Necator americanus]
ICRFDPQKNVWEVQAIFKRLRLFVIIVHLHFHFFFECDYTFRVFSPFLVSFKDSANVFLQLFFISVLKKIDFYDVPVILGLSRDAAFAHYFCSKKKIFIM